MTVVFKKEIKRKRNKKEKIKANFKREKYPRMGVIRSRLSKFQLSQPCF